ncbi:mitochondrial import receptor subunit TOM7 homolog [Elephas maximus indicus]|uniref:mitochondrial import receptor subunit TOM7 homolog n=1 Tax=Elephas maximus indicus TaxID=99487 RepID=UPI002116FC84|nr:mitochondrial import receptor subunit TOM7 homolog [Elephas maximus indicus]
MVKMSKESKQMLFKGGRFVVHWCFIPLMAYLGFKRGADPGRPASTIWGLLQGWRTLDHLDLETING